MSDSNNGGEQRPRVAVCTPCSDHVSAGFALDLAKLVGFTLLHSAVDGMPIFHIRGTILPQSRENLVSAAIGANASHMLWIDSDMRFPRDGLLRLLGHGVPIIGANYVRRRPPFLPTAEHRDKGYLFTESTSEGLAEVTSCGMGFLLVDMSVFRKMKEPWFSIGYTPSSGAFVGEDIFFCQKARQHGYKVLIDQALSREVKHIGELELSYEYGLQTREAMGQRMMEAQANGT